MIAVSRIVLRTSPQKSPWVGYIGCCRLGSLFISEQNHAYQISITRTNNITCSGYTPYFLTLSLPHTVRRRYFVYGLLIISIQQLNTLHQTMIYSTLGDFLSSPCNKKCCQHRHHQHAIYRRPPTLSSREGCWSYMSLRPRRWCTTHRGSLMSCE